MKITIAACAAVLIVGGGATYGLMGSATAPKQEKMSFAAPAAMPVVETPKVETARLATGTTLADPIAAKIAPPAQAVWPEVKKPKVTKQVAALKKKKKPKKQTAPAPAKPRLT